MQQELAELFGGSRWFMEPQAVRAIAMQAAKLTPATIQAAVASYADRAIQPPAMVGDVAVISMAGPIVYRSSWLSELFGFATIERMQAQFQAALNDPAVRTIVWRCNSPGGIVDMVPEFADEIYAARGIKPITFVADTLIASCAYWLASQGDAIVATRSSRVGAIGTYVAHEDISGMLQQAGITITLIAHGANKVEGNPYEPLTEEARAEIQKYVDQVGDEFDTMVARGRGVTKKVVLDTFGQGRVMRGKDAIDVGLADKQGTFAQVLARLTKGRSTTARGSVAGQTAVPAVTVASVDDDEDGCDQCDEECPCELDECGPECPTCAPACGCSKAAAKAAVTPADAESAIVAEHEAIRTVLS